MNEAFLLQECLLKHKTAHSSKKVVKNVVGFTKSVAFGKGTKEQKMQIYAQLTPYVTPKQLQRMLKSVEKLYPLPKGDWPISYTDGYVSRQTEITKILKEIATSNQNFEDNKPLYIFYKTALDKLALAGEIFKVASLSVQVFNIF